MAAEPTQWREPEAFASGDSLIFQRFLPRYLPSDGWSLHYVLTQSSDASAKKVFEFFSTQGITDPSCHSINVPNFGAGLDAGDYVLSGQLVNVAGNAGLGIAAGEKHGFYYGELTLGDDLTDGINTASQQTFCQKMIPILEAKMLALEQILLKETDVQRTRFVMEDRDKTYERYCRFLEFRNYELKRQRLANTGQDQYYVRPVYGGGW